MKIIPIEKLRINDKVVYEQNKNPRIGTVLEVNLDDGLIVFKEEGQIDYAPPDCSQIAIMEWY